MRFIRSVGTLLMKEIKTEWRNQELTATLLVFALIVVVIFNFAFDLDRNVSAGSLSGMLWVTLVFTGTLGFAHGFGRELDRGSLEGLLLAPVDRFAILLAKILVNWMVMLVVVMFLLPISWILFNPGNFPGLLVAIVLLGTLGYATVGTMVSVLVIHSRMRTILLPVLLLPISVPLFLSAVKASENVMNGAGSQDVAFWLEFLAGYVVIFFTLSVLFSDILFED